MPVVAVGCHMLLLTYAFNLPGSHIMTDVDLADLHNIKPVQICTPNWTSKIGLRPKTINSNQFNRSIR